MLKSLVAAFQPTSATAAAPEVTTSNYQTPLAGMFHRLQEIAQVAAGWINNSRSNPVDSDQNYRMASHLKSMHSAVLHATDSLDTFIKRSQTGTLTFGESKSAATNFAEAVAAALDIDRKLSPTDRKALCECSDTHLAMTEMHSALGDLIKLGKEQIPQAYARAKRDHFHADARGRYLDEVESQFSDASQVEASAARPHPDTLLEVAEGIEQAFSPVGPNLQALHDAAHRAWERDCALVLDNPGLATRPNEEFVLGIKDRVENDLLPFEQRLAAQEGKIRSHFDSLQSQLREIERAYKPRVTVEVAPIEGTTEVFATDLLPAGVSAPGDIERVVAAQADNGVLSAPDAVVEQAAHAESRGDDPAEPEASEPLVHESENPGQPAALAETTAPGTAAPSVRFSTPVPLTISASPRLKAAGSLEPMSFGGAAQIFVDTAVESDGTLAETADDVGSFRVESGNPTVLTAASEQSSHLTGDATPEPAALTGVTHYASDAAVVTVGEAVDEAAPADNTDELPAALQDKGSGADPEVVTAETGSSLALVGQGTFVASSSEKVVRRSVRGTPWRSYAAIAAMVAIAAIAAQFSSSSRRTQQSQAPTAPLVLNGVDSSSATSGKLAANSSDSAVTNPATPTTGPELNTPPSAVAITPPAAVPTPSPELSAPAPEARVTVAPEGTDLQPPAPSEKPSVVAVAPPSANPDDTTTKTSAAEGLKLAEAPPVASDGPMPTIVAPQVDLSPPSQAASSQTPSVIPPTVAATGTTYEDEFEKFLQTLGMSPEEPSAQDSPATPSPAALTEQTTVSPSAPQTPGSAFSLGELSSPFSWNASTPAPAPQVASSASDIGSLQGPISFVSTQRDAQATTPTASASAESEIGSLSAPFVLNTPLPQGAPAPVAVASEAGSDSNIGSLSAPFPIEFVNSQRLGEQIAATPSLDLGSPIPAAPTVIGPRTKFNPLQSIVPLNVTVPSAQNGIGFLQSSIGPGIVGPEEVTAVALNRDTHDEIGFLQAPLELANVNSEPSRAAPPVVASDGSVFTLGSLQSDFDFAAATLTPVARDDGDDEEFFTLGGLSQPYGRVAAAESQAPAQVASRSMPSSIERLSFGLADLSKPRTSRK